MSEPIEQWRAEFAVAIGHSYTVREDGRYLDAQIDNVWQGFLMAKRSQRAIELPEPLSVFNEPGCDFWLKESVENALAAAGCQFKINCEVQS